MKVIEVEQLSKIYRTRLKKGNITALDDVTLSVDQGEIYGLLGPNGAGKTTLMKILLGVTGATSGDTRVFGLKPEDPASRQKLGYLAENHRFPHHLTGVGLLEFTGRLFGMSHGQIDQQIDRLLPMVGMERWGNTKIRKYSKGMLQRIGLAQAMLSDPDVLLLDEPTDGVDPVGKVEIRQVLQAARDQGKTIFLNSHLLSEVESVADRVAILSKGKLVRTDTVENLTRRQSQYQIEANVGHTLVQIPKEFGRTLSISTTGLIVEIESDERLNDIIDHLRSKEILIRAIKPMQVSLEQSFFEIVSDKGTAPEGDGATGTGGMVS
jgi:ABC-2 type transport system ATP-binding protein